MIFRPCSRLDGTAAGGTHIATFSAMAIAKNTIMTLLLFCASTSIFTACVQDTPSSAPTNNAPVMVANADGGWIGSGGEIFEDARNPWFLTANTDVVRYCIKVDKLSVSADADTLARVFEASFQYWMDEFKRVEPYFVQKFYATMGRHQVQRVACDGNEDITIVAGWNQLDQKQKDFLRKPQRLLSIAVRTHYDPARLRGRGFIFLASDQGADSYVNSRGKKLKETWTQEGVLYRVLAHELGHVFGIPHSNHDSGMLIFPFDKTWEVRTLDSLMAAEYPENIVSAGDTYGQISSLPTTLGYANRYETCLISEETRSIFRLDKEHRCLQLVLDPDLGKKDTGRNGLQIYAASEKLAPLGKPVATVSQEFFERSKSTFMTPLIRLNLTPEQTVLDLPPLFATYGVFGPGTMTSEYYVDLQITGAKTKPVRALLRIETNRMVLIAVDAEGLLQTLIN